MFKSWIHIVLFLSSYTPLWVLIALQKSSIGWLCRGGILVVAFLSLCGLYIFIKRLLPRKNSIRVNITSVTPKDNEAMNYFVFYLFPFLGIDLSEIVGAISLILLVLTLGVLYVNSNMIYTNPILLLFGYSFFEVRTDEGKVYGVISTKDYISDLDNIQIKPYDNHLALYTNS